jgi:hypothetical protein
VCIGVGHHTRWIGGKPHLGLGFRSSDGRGPGAWWVWRLVRIGVGCRTRWMAGKPRLGLGRPARPMGGGAEGMASVLDHYWVTAMMTGWVRHHVHEGGERALCGLQRNFQHTLLSHAPRVLVLLPTCPLPFSCCANEPSYPDHTNRDVSALCKSSHTKSMLHSHMSPSLSARFGYTHRAVHHHAESVIHAGWDSCVGIHTGCHQN